MPDKIVAEYTVKVDKALKDLEKMANRLDKIDDERKKAQKGFKSMSTGLNSTFKNLGREILGAFAIGSAVTTFISAIRNAIQVSANFEKQMSKVRAITGATDKEIKQLESSAKKLGSSTKFTATQVGELQEEFAKLGFSTQEILAATEATLSLAAAAGTDLAMAANVSGQVIRAFGLDAEETARVVDVMALSLSKSALNIYSFQESMKFAAPIARAAGIEIETVTALLSKLADAGLRGSIAGTGLKNLLSQLSDANSDLGKELGFSVKNSEDLFRALDKLKDANIDLTKATELTDERSKAAFITLINGADDVRTLTDEYRNARGSANKMAEQMEDNFKGATTKLASAWEGLMLQIAGSNGYLKVFVELMTEYVNLTQRVLASESDLLEKDIESNAEAGRRNALTMKKINLLKEVNMALGVNEQLLNAAYSKKIGDRIDYLTKKIQEQKDIIQDPMVLDKDLKDAQVMLAKYEAELELTRKTQEQLNKAMSGEGEYGGTESYTRSLNQLNKELQDLQKNFKDIEIGSDEWYNQLEKIRLKTQEVEDATTLMKATLNGSGVDEPIDADWFDLENADMKGAEESIEMLTDLYLRRYPESVKEGTDIAEEIFREHFERLMQMQNESFENDKRNQQERADNEIAYASAVASEITSIIGSIAQIQANLVQEELQSLNEQLEKGLITREQYETELDKIRQKQAAANKDAAIFQATISTAQAVVAALGSVPFSPANIALSAAVGAAGAAQIAAIASQPLPQFEEGGWIDSKGLITGRKHKQGGVMIEAEGGEYITSAKHAQQNADILKAINSGNWERYKMENIITPAINQVLEGGFENIDASYTLNTNWTDRNLLKQGDRNRYAMRDGFVYLGKKIEGLNVRNNRWS